MKKIPLLISLLASFIISTKTIAQIKNKSSTAQNEIMPFVRFDAYPGFENKYNQVVRAKIKKMTWLMV